MYLRYNDHYHPYIVSSYEDDHHQDCGQTKRQGGHEMPRDEEQPVRCEE